MANSPQAAPSTAQELPELTIKVVVVAIILAIVLALSNAFLALKIGMLTSASIPAAVLSMGIFRFFRQANILENNLVQTAASAGEAVAGGIVYTVPALVIIQYWHSFSYWENFAIAAIGGLLGVLFSIPLRRLLMPDPNLSFPEGRAIAAILQSQTTNAQAFWDMVMGGVTGGLIEIGQIGLKVLADSWELWVVKHRAVVGFGGGFSAAMIGAGYLIGFRMGISILIGALIGWLFSVPLISVFSPDIPVSSQAQDLLSIIRNTKISYIGIGALLMASVWTLVTLLKPLIDNLRASLASTWGRALGVDCPRTERDIPLNIVLGACAVLSILLVILFYWLLPITGLQLSTSMSVLTFVYCAVTTLLLSVVFSALTAYFSGMVGVSATPGSAFVISGILICAAGLIIILHTQFIQFTDEQILAARAITIIMVSMILSACAISLDNMQDLKVGHLIGATPWKQQVMLILGVLVAASVIPPIMQILFSVYGIAGVMPHPGMDPSHSLPAPPAAVMATLSNAVFHHDLPYLMLAIGAGIILFAIVFNQFLKRYRAELSLLGLGVGIYLPLKSSIPLFIGGVFALLSTRGQEDKPRGTMVACGLVAGAALADVLLAIPFSLLHSPDALALMPAWWSSYSIGLSSVVTIGLAVWFYRVSNTAS